MKKISIIVPIYNVEKYIEECLDSLLAQTLDGLDIILVNDGTKDLSGIIARKYAETYPNLFRYYEKENGGPLRRWMMPSSANRPFLSCGADVQCFRKSWQRWAVKSCPVSRISSCSALRLEPYRPKPCTENSCAAASSSAPLAAITCPTGSA